jgi:hypothetical protein
VWWMGGWVVGGMGLSGGCGGWVVVLKIFLAKRWEVCEVGSVRVEGGVSVGWVVVSGWIWWWWKDVCGLGGW